MPVAHKVPEDGFQDSICVNRLAHEIRQAAECIPVGQGKTVAGGASAQR